MKYLATYARTDKTLAGVTEEMLAQKEVESLDEIANRCSRGQLTAVLADEFGICGTVDVEGKSTFW